MNHEARFYESVDISVKNVLTKPKCKDTYLSIGTSNDSNAGLLRGSRMRLRVRRGVFSIVTLGLVFGSISDGVPARAAETSDAKAIWLLTQAMAAMGGNSVIVSDITLTGTVRRLVGIDDDSGTVTLKAIGPDSSMVLALASGNRTELRSSTNGKIQGSWSGNDGVNHKMTLANVVTEPVWFYPLFAVSRGISAEYLASYVGSETAGDIQVEHIRISHTFAALSTEISSSLQPLSQVDVYLDASTLLPVFIFFNVHPDDNDLVNIPITVTYSDYRVTNGVQVPFHVQRLFGSTELYLDLQITGVVLNSGLSPSQFLVQ